jgi:excinuclease ABC subunit C
MLLESELIRTRLPLYNVQGRRCRHYPFIKITREPWPRVELTYDMHDDGSQYFGPFTGDHGVREVLDALRPLFRWRSCAPLASRSCFEHTTGRCAAPCVGAVSKATYDAQLEELATLLAGLNDAPLRRLERAMTVAAEAQEFEKAAVLRDRLAILRPWWERRRGVLSAIADLETLVVLPGVEAGTTVWLLVRRGRLVHTETAVRPEQAPKLARVWEARLTEPPPSLAVRQEELDQINLIVGWLYRHRESGPCINLSERPLREALRDAWAIARGYDKVQEGALAPISER